MMTLDELLKYEPRHPYKPILGVLKVFTPKDDKNRDEIRIIVNAPDLSESSFSVKGDYKSILKVISSVPDIDFWCHEESNLVEKDALYPTETFLIKGPVFPKVIRMDENVVTDTSVIVKEWIKMVSSQRVFINITPINDYRIFDPLHGNWEMGSGYHWGCNDFSILKMKEAIDIIGLIAIYTNDPVIYYCSKKELVYMARYDGPEQKLIHFEVME